MAGEGVGNMALLLLVLEIHRDSESTAVCTHRPAPEGLCAQCSACQLVHSHGGLPWVRLWALTWYVRPVTEGCVYMSS